MVQFCQDKEEKNRMMMISENKQQIEELIHNKKFGLLDLLNNKNLFRSCTPTIEAFL